ncbi:MAG TPA: ribosome assembly RNA-binding protein YhbY [Arenimonas sp.]|uniref:ribosome assembly RNA-binding protein YhbY n=1 Tax=Arenimonas sp. TaxID=1872635 RepID=UPI002C18F4C5|nr:ribosome assembly RNA-binding protein YhbY [Arenimonas sp.]HMB57164.1 ribosome assembly RNA-binding protein YhbY [Arenimonas sp.]
MSTALTNAQKRYLRGLAHDLKPVILLGAKGVTPALIAELDLALEQHELIKAKVPAEDRETRDAWIADICEQSGAALVNRIGHTAVLYRRSKNKPLVILPKA